MCLCNLLFPTILLLHGSNLKQQNDDDDDDDGEEEGEAN
jgi:hypothetical protein